MKRRQFVCMAVSAVLIPVAAFAKDVAMIVHKCRMALNRVLPHFVWFIRR
ncbi:hypothetical protein RHAB21_00536 [Pseudorhizobium halotolerans]|uniref:Uncharacterized protein n=1 Tax=Pseudorhizobium halotolerans TaxID=1233081 RepID=A0ABN7JXG8_9HYPH|nr:hypothetical protein RHAB21_00536 [Pseudorhizobium halotolerans]